MKFCNLIRFSIRLLEVIEVFFIIIVFKYSSVSIVQFIMDWFCVIYIFKGIFIFFFVKCISDVIFVEGFLSYYGWDIILCLFNLVVDYI